MSSFLQIKNNSYKLGNAVRFNGFLNRLSAAVEDINLFPSYFFRSWTEGRFSIEPDKESDLYNSNIDDLIGETLKIIEFTDNQDDLYLLGQILSACNTAVENSTDIEIL